MRRRWLPLVPVAVMLFALSMNMAHIGSDWLWSAVVAVAAAAAALIYFLQRERQEAGRRLRLSEGGAVMKRRWLFFWVAVAVASFGLIMQAAHIGPINLWIVVSVVAFASGAIVAATLNAARRRLPPASVWVRPYRGLSVMRNPRQPPRSPHSCRGFPCVLFRRDQGRPGRDQSPDGLAQCG